MLQFVRRYTTSAWLILGLRPANVSHWLGANHLQWDNDSTGLSWCIFTKFTTAALELLLSSVWCIYSASFIKLQLSETNNVMEYPKFLSSKKTIISNIYSFFNYNSCPFVVCWLCNGPCIWGKGYNPIIRLVALHVFKKDCLNVIKAKHRHYLIESIKHICAHFKWLTFCRH